MIAFFQMNHPPEFGAYHFEPNHGGEAGVYSQVGMGKERTVGQIVTGMSLGSAVVHGWKAGYLWRRWGGSLGK